MQIHRALLAGGLFILSAAESYDTYKDHATSTADVLIKKYYDDSDGQFAHLWWNSAITFSALVDLSALVDSKNVANHDIYSLLENVYAKHTPPDSVSNENFINPYYDDEGWWALTWIAAYDLTQEKKYLDIAQSIVEDIYNTGQACGGGVWWSRSHRVVATIENVILMGAAAQLSNRMANEDDVTKYKKMADASWSFLRDSGSWDPDAYTISGDIDSNTCKRTSGGDPSTYCQGILIGALLELASAHKDGGYVDLAKKVAQATMKHPLLTTKDGILQEPLGGFSNDTAQFKGIFMRYLMQLHRRAPDSSYVDFTTKNADSIWTNSRNQDGTIIVRWEGNPTNADLGDYSLEVSTSSANQCLIAAAAMAKG
ncbi:hypothetical protein FE257_000881 [Aspergillus nanangensis]|uniref:Glycoside hydrolase family 76 protein n=1 Tax=Aspergillus nanangensis TaxID=2582783 RepID=A0AAD4CEF1_ASPNN|nr:hypothetical protein FE257_000881 [Aspergillus nanangensis]